MPHDHEPRVRRVHEGVSDVELGRALRDGHAWASHELWHRYAPHARRILLRVLGPRDEVDDLLQDVFVQALRNASALQSPEALKGWVSIITVHGARRWLRTRKRWRWILPRGDEHRWDAEAPSADEHTRAALRALHAILDGLAVDEQLAFALRHVDGMELTEVAHACECSLATVKRRLLRAEEFVLSRARADARLASWLGGERWTRR
jgi:RNA polymerase sigma-70 factor (ECF subfamily)